MRRTRRAALFAAVVGCALAVLAPGASAAAPPLAHPLGNFTVNTADRLVVGAASVRVLHAVDIAEIPTLQLTQGPDSPDADRNGRSSPEELTAWAQTECGRIGPQLALTLDGRPAALSVTDAAARTVPGQAGLATTRVNCTFESNRAPRERVQFSDPTSAGLTGWKEVSATALCGQLTDVGGLPEESPSGLLNTYPKDLLSSPLAVTQASFGVTAGAACRAEEASPGSQLLPGAAGGLTGAYSNFVGRQNLTLPVALLAVLLSVALGVGHAVAPGHGKTVIAAYLVGQRGTRRQAFWLGATVTTTHTAGVLLLGVLLSLTSVTAPERFVPFTEVLSGLLLGGVGVFLLRRALAARAGGADHGHVDHGHVDSGHVDSGHGDHGHGGSGHGASDHGHDHGDHDHGDHDHDHAHGESGHGHGGDDHDHAHGESGHGHGGDDHDHGHEVEHRHPYVPDHDQDRAHELVGATALSQASAPAIGAPSPRTIPDREVLPAGMHEHNGRVHSHLPTTDQPLGWRTLATMGVAGGLVPSPSALVVLLGASALGRPLFGAVLVVGYGVGMALTLTLAGLLLLRAQARLDRRGWRTGRAARIVRLLPSLTAGVVLLVGGTIIVRGILTYRGLG